MSITEIGSFADKHGVSLLMLIWFMFRFEKLVNRNGDKLNKLIITNVVIAKTLNLTEEQNRLIGAIDDDPSGG